MHAPDITRNVIRVAAMGDIHCQSNSKGRFRELFQRITEDADVLLLCGDITHLGLPDEASVFIEEAARALARIPVLGVLGNHDFESGKEDAIRRRLSDSGLTLLDGQSLKIYGIGFTGVKGFGGGFGKHALKPWGEPSIKNFVKEATEEARKLEMGLSRLDLPFTRELRRGGFSRPGGKILHTGTEGTNNHATSTGVLEADRTYAPGGLPFELSNTLHHQVGAVA